MIRRVIVSSLAVALVTLAGCSIQPEESAPPQLDSVPSVAVNQQLADQVPTAIRADGKLTFAIDPNYPPMEMMDGDYLRGADVDLAIEVAALLGLQPEFDATGFSNVIPSVAINQFELGISAMWVTDPSAGLVNMVDYFKAGTAMAVRIDDTQPKNSHDGLCGYRVSVEEGSDFIDDMVATSRRCESQGKKGITIIATTGQTEATNLLINDKVDAMIADSPVVAYAVAQSKSELLAVGPPVHVRPYGIAVNPQQKELTQVVAQAVQYLIDSGVYQQILQRWHVQEGAIAKSVVRPATSGSPQSGQ